MESIDGSSLPLGLRLREESTVLHCKELEDDSLFVLYTDGLTEATRDIAAGERRLVDAVKSDEILRSSDPAARIHDIVLHEGARDDVAVMTIRVTSLEIQADARRWRFDARERTATAGVRAELLHFLRSRHQRSELI